MSMQPMQIECNLDKILSNQNIRVSIPANITVAISTDPLIRQNAAERLLGMDYNDKMGNDVLKTSEGIEFEVKLLYDLPGWVDNFKHYLRSAMSYCDSNTLEKFNPKTTQISQQAFNAYYK